LGRVGWNIEQWTLKDVMLQAYDNIELSPIGQELIESRVSTKTPEIYRDIRDIPEGKL